MAPRADPESTWGSFGAHHAFIVGINAYGNGIAPLRTAAHDARRLAELLGQPTRKDRFQVHALLIDAGATGAQLRELLGVTMKQAVGPQDRVIFYFAGHGIAADGDDGPAGYVVPSDASPGDPSSLIAMTEVQAALDALPCRHLLVVLDCCFSGAFRWSSQHRAMGSVPKRMYAERFDRFVKDGARQVITSAAYDQKALDVLVGKATGDRGLRHYEGGEHSPFAVALFRALDGEADAAHGLHKNREREGDGVITATELYSYIRDQIEPQTLAVSERQRQTPSFFPLRGHDKGEFMFLHPHHRLNLPAMDASESPYKGLQSFDEADAHLFYGRERVVQALRERTEQQATRLIVVTGASGTGKSSVIKAGLLPQLRAAGLTILPVMRPGEHPMAALDQALDGAAAGSVLIVDQMEELVTRCGNAQERERFEQRLAELLSMHGPVEKLIITVRSDFEPQFIQGPLKAHWVPARFTVPPFSAAELREVIEMPALQASMIFEPPKLVDQMIDEVVQSAGALPLLSYALRELFLAYQRRGGADRALTQADYDQLGGVAGALTKKADALYDTLGHAEQATLQRVMLRMVSLDGELASKRVPKRDLAISDSDKPLVEAVVAQLIDARLAVSQTEAGVDCIEPAHDALVRAWPSLLRWIDAFGRDRLMLAARVASAAAEYQARRHAKDADGLLWHDNPNLPLLQQELEVHATWFNAVEQDFIRLSVAKKQRRVRIVRGVTVGVTLAVAASAAVAWSQRNQALEAATVARAGELAARAESLMASNPDRGVLLALESMNVRSLPQAEALVAGAYGAAPYRVAMHFAGTGEGTGAELSSDGRAVLLHIDAPSAPSRPDGTMTPTGGVSLWDARTGARRPMLSLPGKTPFLNDSIGQARFSPDGRFFLTAGTDAAARVWDSETGQQRLHLGGHYGIADAAYSTDGSAILSWDNQGVVRVWDAQSGELRHTLSESEHAVAHAQWVAGKADEVLVFDQEGAMRRWRPAAGTASQPFGPEGIAFAQAEGAADARFAISTWGVGSERPDELFSLAQGRALFAFNDLVDERVISPRGDVVATAGTDPSGEHRGLRIYKIPATPRAVQPLFFASSTDIKRVVFSPDGALLATLDANSGVVVRNALTGASVGVLPGEAGTAENLSFSPDGASLLTSGLDGLARLWRVDGRLLRTLGGHQGPVVSARFSADGRAVITVGNFDAVRIWDLVEFEGPFNLSTEGAVGGRRMGSGLSADGHQLAEIDGQVIRLFDLKANPSGTQSASLPAQRVLKGHEALVVSARRSPDGLRLLTASHDGTVRVWDLASGKAIHVLRHEAKLLDDASYSPDGRLILVRSRAGIGVWNASTGERRFVFKGHDVLPTDARFAPDGGTVLSSDMKGRVVQWAVDGSSTRELRPAGASEGSVLVYGIEMSPDGRTLVLPGAESQVLEMSSLKPRFALQDSAVALSPDGQKLLVRRDGVLRVLEVAGGKELSVLAGSHAQASTMSFSPDGRLLLVVSRETEAGLFDVASGRLLRKLAIDEKSVIQGAEFSADGSSIVVLSGERTLRRFPCHECRPMEQLIKDAKRRIARDLTPEERRSVGLPELSR